MAEQLSIVFCESAITPGKVDEDFEDQFHAAKESGFTILYFSFEDLVSEDRCLKATRKIKRSDTLVTTVYRGWMLTPKQYAILYDDLLSKNYQLINTMEEYQRCHYLPDSLQCLGNSTALTVYKKFDREDSLDKLVEKSKVFGAKPVVIKDYVKSEKHHWQTACFVKDASDTGLLKRIINNFIHLRGKYLNEGIVIREFIELNHLAFHSKSGMPLTEEYRLFFCNRQLVDIYDYWEEGEYRLAKPDTTIFEEIARKVNSNFFSMDIARRKNGEFVIIELGDGQVAGLPDKTNREDFYRRLKLAVTDSFN